MHAQREEITVTHDVAGQRFRAGSGAEAAVLEYRLAPGRIEFLHTYVPEVLRGRGMAQQLAHAGLEHARAEGLVIEAVCPFVQAYLRKHHEYLEPAASALDRTAMERWESEGGQPPGERRRPRA